MRRIALVLILSVLPSIAMADANAQFKRGLELYGDGKYDEAAIEFEAAYGKKKDPTILFAWAQAVRNAGDCERAIEMYDDVLSAKLKKTQRKAVRKARTECEGQLAQEAEPEPEPASAPEPAPSPEPEPTPIVQPSPGRDQGPSAWYADPVGRVLLAAGVAGVGVGLGFTISGRNANRAADDEENYFEFIDLKDRAEKRKAIGAVSLGAGGALVVTAALWYVLAGDDERESGMSSWISSDGAGIAWSFGF